MKRIFVTSNSSLRVVPPRSTALTFIAMLLGWLLLTNSVAGTSTETMAVESQDGQKLNLNEPAPYDPWIHLAELTEADGSGNSP